MAKTTGAGRGPGRAAAACAAAAAVVLVAGCGMLPFGEREERRDEGEFDGVTKVELRVGAGSVVVRGDADRESAAVAADLEYGGAEPEGESFRVEDGVLILDKCGQRCETSYTVDLPAGLPVSGEAGAGRIDLSDVGDVDVSTGSGAVALDGVSGDVAVETGNGVVSGTGLDGERTEVTTSNGRIELALAVPQDVVLETSNGAIELTVPEDEYRVSTETGNGAQDVSVPDVPSAEHELRATTGNGGIDIRTP